MDREGQLRLELLDVYGRRLKERVDISLRSRTLSDVKQAKGASASKKLLIKELHGAPNGLYQIEVTPSSYLPVGQFVNLKASGITDVKITFAVDHRKVQSVVFPEYQELPSELRTLLENSADVLGYKPKKGEELYKELDDSRRAGLLNIAAKANTTLLNNGRTVLSYVQEIKELRGDRFFTVVPKELREETKHSVADGLFRPVSGALHHPPEGFDEAGSFKTNDLYGNLQLSFFMRDEDCVADIDIDDAAGLAHVFQVLRNSLTGRPTHPYDIHEILLSHQKLDPLYSFVV